MRISDWSSDVCSSDLGLLHRIAREAVDDARVAGVIAANEIEQLTVRAVLRFDPVLDVGPVEDVDELFRGTEVQPLDDTGGGLPGGGRGERDGSDERSVGKEYVSTCRHGGGHYQ